MQPARAERGELRARPGPVFAAGVLWVGLALGSAAFGHEAIRRQIADLDARIAAHPRDASLYLSRGERHRHHAAWNEAARDYQRARELDPGLDAVDLCLGRMHLDAGHPDPAIESLDRFLRKRPDHVEAMTARARALSLLGRNPEAVQDYTRAITAHRPGLNPDPDLFLERARALTGIPEPRLVDALHGLDEGLATLGPVVSLELEAIDLEVRLGRFDAALARLDRLAGLSPRKESYLVRRAGVLETASRSDEARRTYAEALKAIAALPIERRAARAVRDLERTARSALARMDRASGLAAQDECGEKR